MQVLPCEAFLGQRLAFRWVCHVLRALYALGRSVLLDLRWKSVYPL
jgi:hypothetical protein